MDIQTMSDADAHAMLVALASRNMHLALDALALAADRFAKNSLQRFDRRTWTLAADKLDDLADFVKRRSS